ncbi:MAG: hypothetical protein EOO15_05645 [Chitinophagaceae bacterium]|nr:MAG: hypothetical protein EOO15_05645 [Chitinophagaceae bacterium]
MKQLFAILFLLAGFAAAAQPDLSSPEASIRSFFAGFSAHSPDSVAATVTGDFVLLEEGKVWTMDTLRTVMGQNKGVSYTRENQLTFYRTERKGTMAWVYYDNVAIFSSNGRSQRVHWLESAVLVLAGKRWMVRMLHSTRIVEKR